MRPASAHLAFIRIVIALLMTCFQCISHADQPEFRNWLTLAGETDGNTEIVLIVSDVPNKTVRNKFPVVLEIIWSYESKPDGLPVERELTVARSLYSDLDSIIGPHGIHAMTRTGNGQRHIYYYVDAADHLQVNLKDYFSGRPALIVKVTAGNDPQWQEVGKLLAKLKK